MSQPDFSIIIVNYNTRELLRACLDSIHRSSGRTQYEIIVIDNDSSDGSIEMLRSGYRGVSIIENNDNIGFARACNQGIRASSGRFIILLNSDTEVFPDTLENLSKFIIEDMTGPGAGIVGCRILNPDGSLQYSAGSFPTLWSTVLDMFRPYHERKYLLTGYDREHEVDWVTGAFLVIDRKVIEDVGELDEHFFMYYEEVDLCLRAKKSGWKVIYTPRLSIIHKTPLAVKKESVSAKIASETRRSHLYYYWKNHGYLSFAALTCATVIILFLGLVKLHISPGPDIVYARAQREKVRLVIRTVFRTFADLSREGAGGLLRI